MEEVWKDIKGYEGLYAVSNFGRVKTFYKNKEMFLSQVDNGLGYLRVVLHKNGTKKHYYVHRIVANEFIGLNPNMCVNHKDLNKKNNNIDNLEWVTQSENQIHRYLNKNKKKYSGVTVEKRNKFKIFRARIRHNGKILNLGYFKTQKVAYAYCIYNIDSLRTSISANKQQQSIAESS